MATKIIDGYYCAKCPKCGKFTNQLGKFADEFLCVKCNFEFNPSNYKHIKED